MRHVCGFVLGASLVGCALDETGLVGPADAAAQETAPPPCSEPPGACVAAVPANWSLVAFGSGGASCPSNYQADDVVLQPVVQAGACDCSCKVTQNPVCDKGNLQGYYSSDTSCSSLGYDFPVNGSGCTQISPSIGPLLSYGKEDPLSPSGGTCTANVVTDTTKITANAGRLCTPPLQCREQFCDGDAPSGFALCITTSGAQANCPSGWGTSPIVVGDGIDLACTACSCDVNGPSSCSSATLSLYSDQSCSTLLATEPVDGNCDSRGAAYNNYASGFKYHATLTTVCSATGQKTGTPSLQNPRTICCKP